MELGNSIFGNSRGLLPLSRSQGRELDAALPEDVRDAIGGDEPKGWKVCKLGGHYYIKNDTWLMMPYYWGDDPMIERLPNLVHLDTGLEVQWYKSPYRDAYTNLEITGELLASLTGE